MPYDASNRKDIRRAEKDAKADEIARVDFLRAAMSTVQGRAWFYNLLEFCHLFQDPFSGQALLEAYSKGERNVGLRIFSDLLAHCPDYYIQMVKDANDRRTARDARRSDPDPDDPVAERSGGEDAGWDVEGRTSPYDN